MSVGVATLTMQVHDLGGVISLNGSTGLKAQKVTLSCNVKCTILGSNLIRKFSCSQKPGNEAKYSVSACFAVTYTATIYI